MTWSDGDLLTPDNLNQKVPRRLSIYNVLDYGAVGDGVTDDAAAIQAAIDAAGTAGGGTVFFPEATYLFNSQITNFAENVSFAGTGLGSILQSGVTSGTAIYINNNGAGSGVIRGANWAGLKIVGSGSESVLLRLDYPLDGSMDRCEIIESGGTGLQVGRGQNFTLSRCNIHNNEGWGIHHTTDAAGNQGQTFRVLFNTIKDNGSGTAGTGGLFLQAAAEHQVIGNQIESHEFDANCHGILCWTDRTVITHNIFESNTVPIEIGAKNGLYGQTTTKSVTGLVVTDNKAGTAAFGEARLVNVSQITWRDNATGGTIVVDETNNKYVRINGHTGTITSNVTDGKVFTDETILDSSTASLQATFTDQDATPSVRGRNAFRTANTMATTITDFDEGHTGKIFFVRVSDNNTTFANGASLITGTGGDITPTSGDIVVFCGLAGTGSTNAPVWRVIGYMSVTGNVTASSGTLTCKSGSANNADSAGLHEVAPGRWVPYFTDPTP